MLRNQYLRRGGQVSDFFDMARRLEVALGWLRLHHAQAVIRDRLIFWMVHLCLLQFRVDVLGGVKGELVGDYREEALGGIQPFCAEYFETIIGHPAYLISGNRYNFKQVSELGRFLFNFNNGRARTY